MNDKNGRQPPLPGQPPPSIENDAHSENLALNEKVEICRNYVWGRCSKNTQCKFRHELDFEEMKKILKFCHDYQNPSGCTREHCTFLHTTKDEESLFFATGKLPRVLAERHANMSAAAAETIPQIALFIQESFVGPPPPPPPPPAPVAAPPSVAPVVMPPLRPAPPMMPIQQLPPPPPPPTVSSTTVQQHPPTFSGFSYFYYLFIFINYLFLDIQCVNKLASFHLTAMRYYNQNMQLLIIYKITLVFKLVFCQLPSHLRFYC